MGILFKKHNKNSSIFDLKKYYQTQKHTYFTFKFYLQRNFNPKSTPN